jgi:hypothetical protein
VDPDYVIDFAMDVPGGTVFWHQMARRHEVDRTYLGRVIDILEANLAVDQSQRLASAARGFEAFVEPATDNFAPWSTRAHAQSRCRHSHPPSRESGC